MSLVAGCPRCRAAEPLADGTPRCPVHGVVSRTLWRPEDDAEISYDVFVDHLGTAGRAFAPTVERGQLVLCRFDELDGSDPPAQIRCRRRSGSAPDPDPALALATEDPCHRCELVG